MKLYKNGIQRFHQNVSILIKRFCKRFILNQSICFNAQLNPIKAIVPFASMSRFNLDFRVKAKVLFPQFLLHREVTPTMSLYLFRKYQRVGEPDAVYKIYNIRQYARQFAGVQWKNKDCKHV